MKEKFAHIFTVMFVVVVMLLVASCQSGRADSVNLLLQSDSPTMVSFPLMAASQVYDFSADVQSPMQISLVPITRDLAYTAELRDEQGHVMASVSSKAIQDAVLTIDPGTQHYQVAIKSDNTTLQGIISMQVSRVGVTTSPAAIKAAVVVPTPTVVPYEPIALTIPNASVPCSASSSSGVSVNLRNGPGTEFGIVGTLVYGTSLSVSGKSNNGWFQVVDNGQLVWVSGSVTALGGNCDSLADVTPANLNVNNGMVQLVIADNGWGSVYENIASTDINPSKLITVSAPTLTATRQYQEFTLTLVCSGTGTEGLRWGAAEKPTLKCGSSVVMPLTTAYRQQVIAVTMPPTMVSNTVQYTLMASRRI
jgi:hypothetical protein